MTTPQGELLRLSQSINRLCNLFEEVGGEGDIGECFNRIDTQTQEISRRLDVLQDQMSLIIKLLAKDDSVG